MNSKVPGGWVGYPRDRRRRLTFTVPLKIIFCGIENKTDFLNKE